MMKSWTESFLFWCKCSFGGLDEWDLSLPKELVKTHHFAYIAWEVLLIQTTAEAWNYSTTMYVNKEVDNQDHDFMTIANRETEIQILYVPWKQMQGEGNVN